MSNRWRWARALVILAASLFVFFLRTAGDFPSVYEARSLTVMARGESLQDETILQDLASGRSAGIYHLTAEGDIAPAAGSEKVIGVSLSKDRGLLGVFDSGKKPPVLLTLLDTLPIQEIRIVPLESGRNAILIRELLDERFGAYFLSTFTVLYTWEGEGLKEVWRKVTSNEQQWNKSWLKQGKGWQGISEEVKTNFKTTDANLVIKTITNQTLWSSAKAGGPRETIRSRTLTHTYRWEPEWMAMVMFHGKMDEKTDLFSRQGDKYVKILELQAGETVAVLEDEGLRAWINSGDVAYWRVKTKSGLTGYVPKRYVNYVSPE